MVNCDQLLAFDARIREWLGEPAQNCQGASPADLQQLEQRLGQEPCALLRDILLCSNGGLWIDGLGGPLLSCEEFNWLSVAKPAFADAASAWPDEPWARDLASCLQITTDEDGYFLALNPNVRDANGHWEAWQFSPTGPTVFPNLAMLLESARTSHTESARWPGPLSEL